jgi:hypothetical protein
VHCIGDFVDTSTKVANAHKFRKHAEEALRLAPNDSTVHHMLGRWCFEVAGVSASKRWLAGRLYGDLPGLCSLIGV